MASGLHVYAEKVSSILIEKVLISGTKKTKLGFSYLSECMFYPLSYDNFLNFSPMGPGSIEVS